MSEITVRQATQDDWPKIHQIEHRWAQENVEPLPRETFDLWLRVHPQGFLVGETSEGGIVSHAYFECIHFDPDMIGFPGWDSIFTRPYTEPAHTADGNSTLILNAVTVPGTSGGLVVVNKILELARAWGKQWFITIPRMPGLSAYLKECLRQEMGREIDIKTLAAFYAVRSMMRVEAEVSGHIAIQACGLELPEPDEPDQVVARFAGKKLGVKLYAIIASGYPDPRSLNLAALCAKQLY